MIINNYYIKKAKKKLELYPNLVKIGITGSFGKTSTKDILNSVLEKEFLLIFENEQVSLLGQGPVLGMEFFVFRKMKYPKQINHLLCGWWAKAYSDMENFPPRCTIR